MDIFHIDKISLFILLILPGFISIKVWGMIVPSQPKKMNESFFDAACYSVFNFALLFWLVLMIGENDFQNQHPLLFIFSIFFILFIGPVIWPFLFLLLIKKTPISRFVMNSIPTAWDYHFKKGDSQYIIVHLKNGHLIGGLWGFSSSFPNPEDLYLSETWKIGSNGEFIRRIEFSNGMWISKENIDYLEFLRPINDD